MQRLVYLLRIFTFAVVATSAVSPAASAQSFELGPWLDKGFVNVSFGTQPASRTTVSSGSQVIYDETATFRAPMATKGRAIVDVTGGVRLWQNVGAAVGFNRYSNTVDSAVEVSVPDWLVFDSPHLATVQQNGLAHRETAVHVSAVYGISLTPELTVLVMAGPSFITLKKDVVTGMVVDEATRATEVSSLTIGQTSKTKGTGNFGVDVRYLITERLGAGFYLRHAGASVDVAGVEGGTVKVGGMTAGFGARVKF